MIRASEAAVIDRSQTSKVSRTSHDKNCPPYRFLVPHIMTQPFENDQKGELYGPKTTVEEDDLSNRLAEEIFRPIWEIGWRWRDLAG